MKNVLDAFWRAALYCLHPRVIALSILPLVIMSAATLAPVSYTHLTLPTKRIV